MDALSLPTIARRIEGRLQLLHWHAADAPERQHSLEAAIGWSYELLSEPERRLFRCLGVFVGCVSSDALAAVAGSVGDLECAGHTRQGIISLAHKSLVMSGRHEDTDGQEGVEDRDDTDGDEEMDGGAAFGVLETVRQYAWEQLAAAGELEAARRAHARYFLALAERADPQLRGPDQRAWFLRLEREHANLRAALRWLLDRADAETPGEPEAGLRLAGALGYFWHARGYHAEGTRWLEEALARAPVCEGADLALRTQALIVAGRLETVRGDNDRALALLREALALAERRHDRLGIAQSLTQLGACALYAGEAAEGVRLLQASLECAREVGDPFWIGHAHILLGAAATMRGDYAQAAAYCADALDRFRQTGDVYIAGLAHYGLAQAAHELGEFPRAVTHARAGLAAGMALTERWLIALGAQFALWLAGERADPGQRARLLGAADALVQAFGPSIRIWMWSMQSRLAPLREQLEPDGLGAPYRAGRSLPLREVAAMADHLLEDLAHSLAAEQSPLSVRERVLLRLVAQGIDNHGIADQLRLSASTVSHHLTIIFRKLGVKTRAQAIAVAAQRGLL